MIEKILSLEDSRVAVYTHLTESQLRNRLDPQKGVLIAESPKVINVALDAGCQPLSLLCEEKHILGDAAPVIQRINSFPNTGKGLFPIYTGTRQLLAQLTGYTLTRGVLCAMRRPEPPSLDKVLAKARRVVIVDGVVDATNVGSIFRNAAALGMDAVLMMSNSCDAFNRRAIRVSMGSVFLVPWTIVDEGTSSNTSNGSITDLLHQYGFKSCAMALEDRSIGIDDPQLKAVDQLAIIMGNEGDGLPREEIDVADYVVRIPMHHNVDSLNVAACSAIAFWNLKL